MLAMCVPVWWPECIGLVCAHVLIAGVCIHMCMLAGTCVGGSPICAYVCVCWPYLLGWSLTSAVTLACANGRKTLQSMLDMNFVWQSPAFCGASSLLWG